LPGALTLALGKAGNSEHEEFSALPSAMARAHGKASNFFYYYSIFTNTAYKKIYITSEASQTQYSTSIASQTQSYIYISHRQHNISHTRHRKHNRSNIHRHKSIVVHSASHVHQAVKKRNKLEVGETKCLVKKKRRRLLAPELGYLNLPTEAA
jgi:hypothetical protein